MRQWRQHIREYMQIARVCTSIESIERDIGDRDDGARVRINAQIRTASRTYTQSARRSNHLACNKLTGYGFH